MTSCTKCGKDNQDHYKFCLGCGAELSRDAAPKAAAPQAAAPAQAAAAAAPAPAAAPAAKAADANCPQCGTPNGPGNLFCGSCGFRLTNVAAPGPSRSEIPAPMAPAAAVAPAVAADGKLAVLTALRADGSEAGVYPLPAVNCQVGRETGGIFAADSYLSPSHASFRHANGKLFVKDQSSLNGVYKKLARDTPVVVREGDVFRIGQEIVRYEALEKPSAGADGVERLGSPAKGYIGRLALIVGRETTGNAFPIPDTGIHVGRERGDVLFPEDGYVSGLHCRLFPENGNVFLTDLGSSNGTFLRIHDEIEVANGDVLLMGQQLFRVAL